MKDSPGLALLVTCSYDKPKHLRSLPETIENAKEMKQTFNYLNYVIHKLQDPTKKEVQNLMKMVSCDLQAYDGLVEDKVIIFAFSGYGCFEGRYGTIFSKCGGRLDLEREIVRPLTRHAKVSGIPKLFLIDACRGPGKLMEENEASIAGVAKPINYQNLKSYDHLSEKGLFLAEANCWIEYCMIPEHKSYAYSECGESVWMPKLARALRDVNDSFQNIIDKVRKDVIKELGEGMQTMQVSQSVSSLLAEGGLYLQKLSSSGSSASTTTVQRQKGSHATSCQMKDTQLLYQTSHE